MSDGTINLPKRSSEPDSPTTDRYKIYVDGNDDEVKFKDDAGVVKTFKGDQGTQGIQGVQGIQGIQGLVGPVGPMNVEGLVLENATVTLPNTTTPTIVYTDAITISTTGNHILFVMLAVRPHNASNDTEYRVDFDGSPVGPLYAEEGKDVNGAQSNWRMAMIPLGNVAAGTYDLDLLFSKESTGGTAQLKYYAAAIMRY